MLSDIPTGDNDSDDDDDGEDDDSGGDGDGNGDGGDDYGDDTDDGEAAVVHAGWHSTWLESLTGDSPAQVQPSPATVMRASFKWVGETEFNLDISKLY